MCHGIPMEYTKLLFIRGLRSWPEIKMRRHLKKTLEELNIKVLSVKCIANFNDAFFKIKIVGTNHFSYAFKKQEMVQVLAVNIHVEYH